MNFIIYDLIFLLIFLTIVSLFLYKNRKNVKREGILLLYRTKIGIKLIKNFGEKNKKPLNILSYFSVFTGIILMISSLFLFFSVLKIYIFEKVLVSQIKVPPIMPLLPYVPQLFKMSNLPPFYFSYWIIALAITAIIHEFSHGVFAINKGIKTKNTGFGFFPFFLPIFLAAFVEIDEKKMQKKKALEQLPVLSAGTFSNLIIGFLSLILLIIYFNFAFVPSGVYFNSYSFILTNNTNIEKINNFSIQENNFQNVLEKINNQSLNEVLLKNNKTCLLDYDIFIEQKENYENGYLFCYEDLDAIRKNLTGIIVKINENEIKNTDDLKKELSKYKENDKIKITTLQDDFYRDYELTLKNNSFKNASIGIAIIKNDEGFKGFISSISSLKDPNIYYKERFKSSEFFYYLIWWIMMINFSVAILNMLPAGIFDGGRFFYLICLFFTKNKKKAEKIFKIITYILLLGLFLMMGSWLFNAILR
jgi:membrane-associated protease RseP (regulator of RpoE activity)